MKALLVEPRPSRTWGVNNQCIGLLRIARWLTEQGHAVEYVIAPNMPKVRPDEIWITSMFTYDYRNVWEAIKIYGKIFSGVTVHLGGVYATICPDHAAGAGADDLMIGQHPEAKEFCPMPSVLPTPAKFAYLFTSYGCNRACTYCATHLLYGDGIRQLEVERVVDDIQRLVSEGFEEIWLGDDNLLYNAENHLNLICQELIRRHSKARISVFGGMAAKDLTLETARLMKTAGFKTVSYALESISADVRKRMGRANNATEEDLLRALAIGDIVGFKRSETNVYHIIGLPYQQIEDMVGTLVFLYSQGVWAHPQRLTPIPNTVDWQRMKLQGTDYADLHYQKFVAPDQDNFRGDDLHRIGRIARFINIARRSSGGFDPLTDDHRVSLSFRKQIAYTTEAID